MFFRLIVRPSVLNPGYASWPVTFVQESALTIIHLSFSTKTDNIRVWQVWLDLV
jgi:hypothetical protein